MKKNKEKIIEYIQVFGAKEHNLKNIDVKIPKNKLTVITGPSGSGKSSLALDILFTEGKRRYVESLSAYARQFLGISKKPKVDRIEGLCPAIAIEQKTVGLNPRSTVGTITEIYDYLRVLFARIGIAYCPECNIPISSQSADNIVQVISKDFINKPLTILAPIAIAKKGEFTNKLTELFNLGYYQFLINGQYYKFSSANNILDLKLNKNSKHNIDIVIDDFVVDFNDTTRIQEAIELCFKLALNNCKIISNKKEYIYSSNRICIKCSFSFVELEPRLFSFNSPMGACTKCHGLGTLNEASYWSENLYNDYNEYLKYHKIIKCNKCDGKRLKPEALCITINNKNIFDLSSFSIKDLLDFFIRIDIDDFSKVIANDIIREIISRLKFLINVGLSYLSLNRSARTLSGGEGQRIRLATQIGSNLSGVLYILDEPSIGLHQRDNDKLIDTLKKLRDQGNTVLVVEHDMETMQQADYLIDMGPAAGILGGTVTAYGMPEEVAKNKNSLTGAYLAGTKSISMPSKTRISEKFIILKNASKNNLKNIDVKFPLEVLTGISGVSGSGKSSLIIEELVPAIKLALIKSRTIEDEHDKISNINQIKDLVVVDQTPIGRTPRSNPATYLGIFDDIRALFAQLPESNLRGYTISRFSFNVAEGRCFECMGDGTIKVSMHFLPDVIVQCKACHGKRYNSKTLEITYKGKTIADILNMTAYEALGFFSAHTTILKRLQLLCDVGLDYITLGQSATTFSGGEAQRIKLVKELAKRGNQTLYILDEPTTGLHNNDIEKLLAVLNRLVDKGNTVIVIEHNLDVLKAVDYLIDMGPEGGNEGGYIVAQGTPKEVAQSKESHTGSYLRKII